MKLLKAALFFSIIFSLSVSCFALEPNHIDSALNSAKLQGTGRLNFWGFHIYDASLYRAANPAGSEFALDIRYHKSFSGISIANRSVDEMKKIGIPEGQAASWGKELAHFLPNIEPGHSLTAIYNPSQGTIFYHNGKRIAQVPGAEFSKAFFGIWLDPKTSVPTLRKDLLGQSCSPPLFNEAC
jgi:Chalcone isomerase-like